MQTSLCFWVPDLDHVIVRSTDHSTSVVLDAPDGGEMSHQHVQTVPTVDVPHPQCGIARPTNNTVREVENLHQTGRSINFQKLDVQSTMGQWLLWSICEDGNAVASSMTPLLTCFRTDAYTEQWKCVHTVYEYIVQCLRSTPSASCLLNHWWWCCQTFEMTTPLLCDPPGFSDTRTENGYFNKVQLTCTIRWELRFGNQWFLWTDLSCQSRPHLERVVIGPANYPVSRELQTRYHMIIMTLEDLLGNNTQWSVSKLPVSSQKPICHFYPFCEPFHCCSSSYTGCKINIWYLEWFNRAMFPVLFDLALSHVQKLPLWFARNFCIHWIRSGRKSSDSRWLVVRGRLPAYSADCLWKYGGSGKSVGSYSIFSALFPPQQIVLSEYSPVTAGLCSS